MNSAAQRMEDNGFRRDRAVRRLRELINAWPTDATRSMKRLVARFDRYVKEAHEEKQKGARERLLLLELAKTFMLNPGLMSESANVEFDPNSPPSGFDPVIATWHRKPIRGVWDAYRALGYYDLGVDHTLQNHIVHLKKAKERGFDVEGKPAIDAYAFAISEIWSQGRMSEDEVRAELDVPKVRSDAATREMGLFSVLRDELAMPLDRILTEEECWDRSLVLLLAHDPSFDGAEVGLRPPMPWRVRDDRENWMSQRSIVIMIAGIDEDGQGSTKERATLLLELVGERLETYLTHRRHREERLEVDAQRRERPAPRRSLPTPTPDAVRRAMDKVRLKGAAARYTAAELVALYEVPITPTQFVDSTRYVSRRDDRTQPHQLPKFRAAESERASGRFVSTASWSKAEVLAALKGWAGRLGVDASGPF